MEDMIKKGPISKETPVESFPRMENIVNAPIIDSQEEDKTYESEASLFKDPLTEENQIESYGIKTVTDTDRVHGKPTFEFINREGMNDK